MFVTQEAWGDYWPWDLYQQEPTADATSGQLVASPLASCCTSGAVSNDIDEEGGLCTVPSSNHSSSHPISGYEQKQPLVATVVSSCNPAENAAKLGPALNTNGKPRARRGSATDPQSVYARNRRERINQRLKTLQHLVPNGSKVDIVTMLEEAVHYVKFLQLQVKLLSSDEFWMYAPTAYNGVEALAAFNIQSPS